MRRALQQQQPVDGPAPAVTGGSLAFVNIGKMIGPIAFANAYLAGGSYAVAFALLALPAAAGLACMLAAHGKETRPVEAAPPA